MKNHVPGWMDGWVDGWMDGRKSHFKDCLQQKKNCFTFGKGERMDMNEDGDSSMVE